MKLVEIAESSIIVEVYNYECFHLAEAFRLAARGAYDGHSKAGEPDDLGMLYESLAMFFSAAGMAAEVTHFPYSHWREAHEGESPAA
jgi:hypothetical protein